MYGIQVAVTVSCCVLFISYIALYSRYLNQDRDVLNDITQVNTTSRSLIFTHTNITARSLKKAQPLLACSTLEAKANTCKRFCYQFSTIIMCRTLTQVAVFLIG